MYLSNEKIESTVFNIEVCIDLAIRLLARSNSNLLWQILVIKHVFIPQLNVPESFIFTLS